MSFIRGFEGAGALENPANRHLSVERARAGMAPGLLAETPRDAIQATLGSAIDALVIGRFLVAKDYWLMRQPVD